MPLRSDIKKVLVIGSGPIIIGQAAEFDYAGTQACRALKQEGIEVVLINSNPANISEAAPLLTKSTSEERSIFAAGVPSIVCIKPRSKNRYLV